MGIVGRRSITVRFIHPSLGLFFLVVMKSSNDVGPGIKVKRGNDAFKGCDSKYERGTAAHCSPKHAAE